MKVAPQRLSLIFFDLYEEGTTRAWFCPFRFQDNIVEDLAPCPIELHLLINVSHTLRVLVHAP